MEDPPFSWYLPGKMGIFHGYVSLPEGNTIYNWILGLPCSDIPEKKNLIRIGSPVLIEKDSSLTPEHSPHIDLLIQTKIVSTRMLYA